MRRIAMVTTLLTSSLIGSFGIADAAEHGDRSNARVTLAVIGDAPYGADQVDPQTFEGLLADIGADPQVRTVVHLGDIKNGSTPCDDAYFDQIADAFAGSRDPVIYTPGDNEWTDCHRPTNGGYDPYDRLAALRSTFFAEPDQALGRRPMAIESQSGDFVENARWVDARVVFTTVHVVGSNNGLAAWSTPLETPENAARRELEVAARIDAAVEWIDAAFDEAEATGAPGVVVAMQADTFQTQPMLSGFSEVIDHLEARAAAFAGEVLLLQGDSHRYLVDQPLPDAPNLTRIVVEGETVGEWLRLTIDPRADDLFTWERVPR
jgi:hypothetical protein